MEPIDYREHPNTGQHESPPAETREDPNAGGTPTAPQPQLKGRGYSLNELGAKPNQMQPASPDPVPPDPYTGTTISDWEYMGSPAS